jgi:hypothetical protein
MTGHELQERRREAIHQLCLAQAQGTLSVELFEERLALVREAPTPAAIIQLIADLDVGSGKWAAGSGNDQAAGYPRDVSLESYAPDSQAPQSLRMTAIFASTKRRGQWVVPYEIETKVIMGELTIDLRDALFAWDTLLINVDVTLGELKVVVPVGTRIENEIDDFIGGGKVNMKGGHGAEPNGLVVHLYGSVRFGSVDVRQRLSTEAFPPDHFTGIKGFFNRKREGLD